MAPKQLMFATAWGLMKHSGGRYETSQLPQVLDKLKALGYDGLEMPIAYAMQYGCSAFASALESRGLKYIAMVFSSGPQPIPGNMGLQSEAGITHPSDGGVGTRDVALHLAIWTAQVREALALPRSVLVSVTSHTGKDFFTEAEADAMFAGCAAFEASPECAGVPVAHETHRGRTMYSPWVMERLLAAHPTIRLCADYSHFSCVAESGPSEPEINRVIALCAPRVRHVHARVGFEEGPQIPDPRAPAWAPYMEGYLAWWRAIFAARAAAGEAVTTCTPEFGPALYAWTHAYTGEVIHPVWPVNHYVAGAIAKAYGEEVAPEAAARVQPDEEEGVWTFA